MAGKRRRDEPAERKRRGGDDRTSGATRPREVSHAHAPGPGIQPEAELAPMLEALQPGDHLCLIYESPEEWRAAAVPFIAIGLRRGEKCLYVVDTSTAGEIRRYLAEEGVDVASMEKSGQLSILHHAEAYTRQGSFDPDAMIALLISETQQAIAEGYPALRVTGEMTWVLRGHPGSEKLLEYEARLNSEVFPHYRCLAICQYDRWKFDPELIRGVVIAHPLIVRGNRVYRNFYYIPPDEFLSEKRAEREVQHWLNSLERQRRGEETLRRSEGKYRSLVNNIDVGIFRSTPGSPGRFLEVNPAMERMTGYSREELLSIDVARLYLDPEERGEAIREAEQAGRVSMRETRCRKKDGSELVVADTTVPVRDSEGRVVHFDGILADITAQRQADEALHESEERFRLLAESTPEVVYLCNNDERWTMLYLNDAVERLTGYSREPFLSDAMSFSDLYLPEDRDIVYSGVAEALEKGTPFHMVYRIVRADGELRWVEEFGDAVRHDGDVRYLVGIIHDITERKEAEDRVRHLNRVLRAIRDVNQLITKRPDRETLLEGACRTLVETRGYHSAWIALLDDSGKLIATAEAGLGRRFAPVRKSIKAGELPHCGRRALERPGVVVIRDLSSECTGCPVAKEHTGRGGMSVRLEHEGKVYGMMTVSLPGGIAVEKEEQELFEEVAGDIAYALYSIELEEKRTEAEEAVRRSQQLLQTTFDSVQDGISVLTTDLTILSVNKTMENWYPDDHPLQGKKCYEVYQGRTEPCEVCPSLRALKTGRAESDEVPFAVGGKAIGVLELYAFPMVDDNGKATGVVEYVRDVTERKQAEEELARSEQSFRDSIEESPLGIRIVTEEGKTLYVNRAILDMCGYGSGEELMAVPQKRLHTPESYAEHRERVSRRKRGEPVPADYEISILRRDGAVRHLWVSRKEVLWDGEKRFQMVYQDITERKQAEARLADSTQRLGFALQGGGLGMWDWSPQDGAVVYSDIWAQMLEYRPDEVEPTVEFFKRRIHPEDRAAVLHRLTEHVEGRSPVYESEHRLRTRSGGWLWVMDRGKIVERDNDGSPLRVTGIIADITARKQAEEALKAQTAYFQQLFNSSPDAIAMVDMHDRVIRVNRGFEALFGYSREEVTGRSLNDLVIPGHLLEEGATAYGRALDGGVVRKETVRRRKDGSLVDVYVLGYPIRIEDGVLGVYVIYTDITERRQAEEAREAAERSYRLLAENTADVVSIFDLDLNLLWVSPSAVKQTGYTAEELMTLPVEKTMTPESIEKAVEAFSLGKRLYDQGEDFADSFEMEGEVYRKDGSTFWSENRYRLIRDSEGNPAYILMQSRDITERRQAGLRQRAAEETVDDIIETAPFSIQLLDPGGYTVRVNPAFMKLFGVAPPPDYTVLDDPNFARTDVYRESMKRLAGGERIAFPEFYYNTRLISDQLPDNPLWIRAEGFPLFDDEGRVKNLVLIHEDVTERRKAEAELRESEERYRALFDRSRDLLYVYDFEGNLLDANEATLRLTGYEREDIPGLSLADLLSEDQRSEAFARVQEMRETGTQVEPKEFRVRRKDGSFVDIEAMAAVVYRDGEPYAIQGLARDLTERKKMQEQLVMTDRLASIGQLASGIAHELNNPLTSVIGFSDMLLSRDLPADVREDLEVISSEARRTSDVVKGLLAFARKQPTDKVAVDVNRIIHAVLQLRAYEQRVSNIAVDARLASDLPPVVGNGPQLQQVFINIIINAEQEMIEAHGRGKLTVITELIGDTVRATIADDGPGIRPDVMKRLFTPFLTTKEVGRGTGLGLSICHGIVTEHGGTIYARSKPGEGATFVVELPAANR